MRTSRSYSIMRFVLALLIGLAPLAASAAIIGDPSFEDPAGIRLGGYVYNPSGLAWTFASDSGVDASSGVFFVAPPPDGTQAAFIQSGGPEQGHITQALNGLTIGTTYTFSLYAAERPGYAADPIDVSFAGQDLGTITPSSTAFVLETTKSFVAAGTSGELSFLGAPSTGDNDSAIDLVTLSGTTGTSPGGPAVPEPGSLALLCAGLLGLGVMRRQRL